MTPEEIYEKIKDIPGWFELEEIKALATLQLPSSPFIVECGTYRGRSATAFSLLWPKARIVTCDPYPDPLLDLPPQIQFVGCKGKDLPINEPIDLLFIDDSHQYDDVKDNYYRFWNQIKPNGYVAFHDVTFETDDVEGVKRFIKELGTVSVFSGRYGIGIVKK